MRAHHVMSCLVLSLLIPLSTCPPLEAAADEDPPIEASRENALDPGEQLLEAAQLQDLSRVKELVESGVDVNFKSRYGATALFFAVDKGNLEIVELLVENDAEIDVQDTFYNATPITWALFSVADSPVHKQIVLLLLERGSQAAPEVLAAGARMGDLELVRGALAATEMPPRALRSGLLRAQEEGHDEIAALLAPLAPEEIEDENTISADVLAQYEGDYKNDDIGMQGKVFLVDGTLNLQAVGQPALALAATGDGSFTARDEDGIDLTFRTRGGLVDGFLLRQAGQELFFARFDPAEAAASAAAPLAPLAQAVRSAAISWPRFRGPNASGIGDGQGVPFTWDGASEANVLWKTEIPGLALSSPVVWGDRVFVSTAVSSGDDAGLRIGLYGDVNSVDDDSQHVWKVYGLSKTTGEVLWATNAAEGAPKVKRHQKSSHANPTPATDGKRVVVHFPSVGLFCFDIDGRLLWEKDLGVLSSGWFYDPTYQWGFASSPILHDGKVIVQVDIQRGSFIAAFDSETGDEVWRTSRDEIPTWGTPVVLSGAVPGSEEIVTNGTTVRGYDAESGEELWTLGPNSEITVASPVAVDGVAFVTGGYPPARPVYAIRNGSRGDLSLAEDRTSSEAIAWSHPRGGVYMPTPIAYRGILYLVHNNGRLVAYDASTGDEIYRERLGSGESFTSSPVAADGRLLMTSEDGTTYVVRAGETYELLRTNELDEIVMATPAISDGVLLVRGARHLWALAPEEAPSPSEDRDETP